MARKRRVGLYGNARADSTPTPNDQKIVAIVAPSDCPAKRWVRVGRNPLCRLGFNKVVWRKSKESLEPSSQDRLDLDCSNSAKPSETGAGRVFYYTLSKARRARPESIGQLEQTTEESFEWR